MCKTKSSEWSEGYEKDIFIIRVKKPNIKKKKKPVIKSLKV